MDFELDGLTDFQKDLLNVAQKKMPKQTYKIMRKIGNKAVTEARKVSRSTVDKKTGNYYKGFKRGKVFKDDDGQIVVRALNTSPHAHLIEYGHRLVSENGVEFGFVTGKRVMKKGMDKFDESGQFEKMLSEWLDDMLDSGDL